MKAIILSVLLLVSYQSHAKLVQILHTNDIHSYFEHINHDDNVGGYARLKTMIDKLKAEAAADGIETIVVDAGDFLEGHLFYMSDNGRKAFEMQDRLGYDIVTIGNHDYLMGSDELNDILGDVKPKFAFLGANLWTDGRYEHINNYLKPYHSINVNGVNIAFMGLTTNEIVFKWRVHNGGIKSPYRVGKELSEELAETHDVVIGLTHLGVKADKKLVKKTKYLDLVIGGHSHDFLEEPVYQKNRNGKKIPIVQAGKHAKVVGRVILDVSKEEGAKLVDYALIQVKDVHKDQEILDFIEEAKLDLNELYGREWLYETVGMSHFPPDSHEANVLWNYFITDAVREGTQSDISIHTPSMAGSNYPIGEITRYDLFNSHPRFFDFHDTHGWFIYRAKIRGYLLKSVFKAVMNFGLPLTFAGITFDWKKNILGKYNVSKLRIKGEKIKPLKLYEIALPEGIARGARGLVGPLAPILFKKIHRSNKTMIAAIEDKVFESGHVGMDYLSKANQKSRNRGDGDIDRVYFPGRER